MLEVLGLQLLAEDPNLLGGKPEPSTPSRDPEEFVFQI